MLALEWDGSDDFENIVDEISEEREIEVEIVTVDFSDNWIIIGEPDVGFYFLVILLAEDERALCIKDVIIGEIL
jgi:hypothetical protein